MAIEKNKFPKTINKDLPYDVNQQASDALNIDYLGTGERVSGNAIPRIGNYPAFDLGSVSQQNKIYRILIPSSGAYQITVKATNNSTVLFTANFSDQITAVIQINTQAAASGNNAVITQGSGYIDVQLIPNPNVQAYRWFMTSTGTDDLTIQVLQEAIEPTLAGELLDIGGYDLLGDLFIYSSSQRNLPTVLAGQITNATNASPIVITYSAPHGLVNNQWVLITEVEGNTAANGNWSVQVINATTFSLVNSIGNGAYTTGGEVTAYPSGIGEIGVAQKNLTTLEWTYTRLLRSVEWNFRTKKQIDCHVEKNFFRKNFYWVDDYNSCRAAYYEGDYVQDGMLSINGGLYEYDFISEETQLRISDTQVSLEFVSQSQTGGAVTAGNKRYTIRLLTENLTATNWLELSNPISVFSASTFGSAELLIGNVAGDATTKINTFEVSGIPAQLFKYIELAVIEYFGGAVSGNILKRNLISGETMTISHTGLETDLRELDIAEVTGIPNTLKTAKNIRAIDNRLILSNLTSLGSFDLTEWANKFKHELKVKELPRVGAMVLNTNAQNPTVNEYQLPENVYNYAGYAHNEKHRFGVYVDWIGGGRSECFWVDDVTFNTDPTTPDGRRIAGLPDYSILSDVSAANQVIKTAYIEFSNIDLDFLVDGQRIGDLIENIHIVRVELNELQREVIATGVIILGVSGQVLEGPFNNSQFVQHGVSSSIFDYPYVSYKRTPFNPYVGSTTNAQQTYPNGFTAQRQYCSFYSPDILYSGVNQSLQNYTLKVLRNPQELSNFFDFSIKTNGAIGGVLRELGGFYPDTQFNDFTIDDSVLISAGGSDVIGGSTYSKFVQDITGLLTVDGILQPSPPRQWNNMDAMVIHTTANITPTNSTNDFGMYYAQIYVSRPDKFGDIANSVYIPTGASILPENITSLTSAVEVFGGDIFVQKTFLKERIPTVYNPVFLTGMGSAWSFYSQNRVNAQMKYESAPNPLYPLNIIGTGIQDKTKNWLESTDNENYYYDATYTIKNEVVAYAAFDSDTLIISDLPTRIIWSDLKPQNSIVDRYRVFLPLNFKDLDNSDGEITHHERINGELFTIQLKKWQRQFFNTRGVLEARNISDILIGDGSVMSRDGITISNFGSQNKWSCFKGKSKGGNDVMYWWDGINKMFMRFGGDGTLSISEIKGLEAFCASSMNWVIANDTPADGSGIHGVWNQRYGEAIWIVRTKRQPSPGVAFPIGTPQMYNTTTSYPENAVVFYDNGINTGFGQDGEFYRSTIQNNIGNIPGSSAAWSIIPRSDVNYWNEFSVVYNEKLQEVTQQTPNGFATFLSPLPFIAHEWTNGYVSPRPISPLSKHYEEVRGDYLRWYIHNGVAQEAEGYVELIVNKDVLLNKLFKTILVKSKFVPYKISLFTEKHETFVSAADFEQMVDVFSVGIRNDILTANPLTPPLNEQDTSELMGVYCRVRFYFKVGEYNEISDFVVNFIKLYPNYINQIGNG